MIALLCSLASADETWWVPDETAAAGLSAAAASEWPAVGHTVLVGARPDGAQGWTWDGATVNVVGEGDARSAPAADPHLAVILARTWAIRTETPPFERFVPELPPAEVDPVERARVPRVRDWRPRWALGLRAGTRTGFGEPFPLQGVRGGLTLEKNHVWSAIDVYYGVGIPVRGMLPVFGAGDGVSAVTFDQGTVGFDLGWKGVGKRYGFGWVGPQVRGARHVLFAERQPESEHFTMHFAVEGGAGIGLDARHLRADVSAWTRITGGLPPTVGVQLDGWWVIFNPRRRT